MNFLKRLFQWFFGGSDEQPSEPNPETLMKPPKKEKVDLRPHSERVLNDIFSHYSKDTILNDLHDLETQKRLPNPDRERIINEIKNIRPNH